MLKRLPATEAEDSGLYIIALLIAEPEEPFGLQRPA
jgi:hypothetical protein